LRQIKAAPCGPMYPGAMTRQRLVAAALAAAVASAGMMLGENMVVHLALTFGAFVIIVNALWVAPE
jgi:hypothetical protein